MNLTESSNKVDAIVDELYISTKREQVEEIFSKNGIDDKSERIGILQKCMHVLDTSNAVDCNSLSVDDEYDDEIEIFLNGKWRFLI